VIARADQRQAAAMRPFVWQPARQRCHAAVERS
jgi:hypothetical protein